MNMAKEVALWSKDPSSKIGAVCVGKHGQILSTGFNGFPRQIEDTEERLNNREEKYKYVIHAEMNAIYNATLTGVSLLYSSLYVYGLPICSECTKGVIQVGVKEIHITRASLENPRWYESWQLSETLFKEAKVKIHIH